MALKSVLIYLKGEQIAAADRMAIQSTAREGDLVSRSEIIRRALSEYLATHQDKLQEDQSDVS